MIAASALAGCGVQRTTWITVQDPLMISEETGTGGGSGGGGATAFTTAQSILTQRCTGCHANYGSMSQAQWVASGLVVAGSSASSTLVMKLRGSGVAGAGDMPADGSSLSGPQITAIRAWIDGL
jgi:mono/diheme cytochrome c family protein